MSAVSRRTSVIASSVATKQCGRRKRKAASAPDCFATLAMTGWVRLAHAFDDEGTAGRIGEPDRQYFLVFRRMVPALHRRGVGEFENDDSLRLQSALDQFGGAASRQVAAAILCDRGGSRRPALAPPPDCLAL